MTEEEIVECFGDTTPSFEWNPSLPSKRADLCAMILLDKLFPDQNDMVFGADHDMIFFNINIEKLAKSNITKEDIMFLCGCGIGIYENGYLYKFV
jgi:hypothetical protein